MVLGVSLALSFCMPSADDLVYAAVGLFAVRGTLLPSLTRSGANQQDSDSAIVRLPR